MIAGGGDSALDWALNFVGKADSVVLVHRRDGFRAAPASVAKMKAHCEQHEMQLLLGQISGFEEAGGQMTEVRVTSPDGVTRRVPLDYLMVFFGLSPRLGPIAEWGLDLERRQVRVDTEKFETNVPGIFAVGDINSYPGKKKLILPAFTKPLSRPSAQRVTYFLNENTSAVHDHQSQAAQNSRRRIAGF